MKPIIIIKMSCFQSVCTRNAGHHQPVRLHNQSVLVMNRVAPNDELSTSMVVTHESDKLCQDELKSSGRSSAIKRVIQAITGL